MDRVLALTGLDIDRGLRYLVLIRNIVRITILLLIGLALNIAVAWRSATLAPYFAPDDEIPAMAAAAAWERIVGPIPQNYVVRGSRLEAVDADMIFLSLSNDENTPLEIGGDYHICADVSVGWPLRSMAGSVRISEVAGTTTTIIIGMFEVPERIFRIPMPGLDLPPVRVLPIRPVWAGTVINTVVYATIAGGLIRLIARIRKRSRLDRQRCPTCRYDLRGSKIGDPVRCSECNTTVPTALFQRPHQLVRWWMAPFFLPIAIQIVTWFFAAWPPHAATTWQLQWLETGTQLRALIEGFILLLLASAMYSISVAAYSDRATRQRHVLAATVGLSLAVLAYIPLSILIACLAA